MISLFFNTKGVQDFLNGGYNFMPTAIMTLAGNRPKAYIYNKPPCHLCNKTVCFKTVWFSDVGSSLRLVSLTDVHMVKKKGYP